MRETWRQTGINGLIFLIFPAIYLAAGKAASSRWPQADMSGYWRWAGVSVGVIYAFALAITFLAGFVDRNNTKYTQTLPDTIE